MMNIVFIHRGPIPKYLKVALKQAKGFGSTLIFLGDNNPHLACVDHFLTIQSLESDELRKFISYYRHMSTNSYEFELICFERWFLLRQAMLVLGLQQVLYLDSDVLIYDRIDELEEIAPKYQCAYCIPENQEDEYSLLASAHTSFWTALGIGDFCDFLVTSYQSNGNSELARKWEHHKQNEIPGGVCDMTLLYLYYRFNRAKTYNLLEGFEGKYFDNNINLSEGRFEMQSRLFPPKLTHKRLRFVKEVPFVFDEAGKELKRFATLHCQGSAKELMYIYQTKESSLIMKSKFYLKKLLTSS